MSCYHPILMKYHGINPDTGKRVFSFTGSQGVHLKESDALSEKIPSSFYNFNENDVLIPCRKCVGCRLDYSRRWADRLMLELDHSKTALFFTLTYDDKHATPAMFDDNLNTFWFTLVKKDVQDFNKRLRFHFSGKEIRFFTAGEYGDKTLRPHYHGIYFGLSLEDFPDAKLLTLNKARQPLYTSELLSKIWKNGHVSIGNVSWQSCAYVARYSLKKLGAGNDDFTLSRNCLPEFCLMSRNPGIAGYFPIEHPEIFDNPKDVLFISDPHGIRSVNSVNMPSYIFSKLKLTNPELYDKISLDRKASSLDSFLKELSNTDLDEFEYLNLKERNHEKSASSLVRTL